MSTTTHPNSKLSIIIPVLNEEENVGHLISAVDRAFSPRPDVELEMLFVDDGSRDSTFNVLTEHAKCDTRIKVIRFARNFGSHAALLAGFEQCTGDAAAYLAADLQEPPEMLLTMLDKWREGSFIVWGTREQRDDPLSSRLFSRLYCTLMRHLALGDMPNTGLDLCLIDRKVIKTITTMREKNTSIFGLILWTGFPQVFVPYHRQSRKRGKSRWTFSKKIKLMVDSFVSFSFAPIRLVTYLGLIFAFLGFGYGAFTIIRALMGLSPVQGWASLITIILFLSGIQLVMLGIVAEYLWRTFDESRRRPPFIIRETSGIDP
jgi:polyisoprenyl-phosphate glycosyltransferase